MSNASRRDVLKIALAGAGAAALPLRAAGRRQDDHAAARKLVHPDLRRVLPEHAGPGLREGDRRQGRLRADQRRQPADPRSAPITETGSGADITLNFLYWPFLFDEKYVDVSDIAEEIGKKQGGWYDAAKEAVVVNGKWKAIPFGNIGQLMNWRTDWFAEVGVKKFPDTWDELLEAGKKLKAKDHPVRLRARPRLRRQPRLALSAAVVLWRRTRSRPTARPWSSIPTRPRAPSISARKFFQETMFEDVLGWTDPSNNKAWMAEQISCTNNAESILWFAKRDFPDIGKVTDQSLNPTGAEGPLPHPRALEPFDLQLLAGPAGGEGLPALADGRRSSSAAGTPRPTAITQPFLHAYDNAPLWHVEPRNIPYRDSLATVASAGLAGAARAAQLAESVAKYVVVDMFAKACAGTSTKEVINDAEAQLKQIYQPA